MTSINTNLETELNQTEIKLRWARIQRDLMRTKPEGLTLASELRTACIGAVGELGELANYIKKPVYHDHPINQTDWPKKLFLEVGDILWYLVYLADSCERTLTPILPDHVYLPNHTIADIRRAKPFFAAVNPNNKPEIVLSSALSKPLSTPHGQLEFERVVENSLVVPVLTCSVELGKILKSVNDFIFDLGRAAGLRRYKGKGHLFDEELQHSLETILNLLSSVVMALGVTLEDCANMVIEKLKIRYPKKFNPEDSLARVDEITTPCSECGHSKEEHDPLSPCVKCDDCFNYRPTN